jgi:hypothetical protein
MRHSIRTGFVIAAAIVGIAVIFWIKAYVGTAGDDWLPRSGSSYGPIQVLTPVY